MDFSAFDSALIKSLVRVLLSDLKEIEIRIGRQITIVERSSACQKIVENLMIAVEAGERDVQILTELACFGIFDGQFAFAPGGTRRAGSRAH